MTKKNIPVSKPRTTNLDLLKKQNEIAKKLDKTIADTRAERDQQRRSGRPLIF
jgi:hypothetical protein